MSYSPSPTPHNTLTLHQHNDDHTQSVAMTTDTANTSTPTIDKRATRELRHHEKYVSHRHFNSILNNEVSRYLSWIIRCPH